MPDNLPDIGFEAVIRNLDEYLRGAKVMQDSTLRIESTIEALAASSERTAGVLEAAFERPTESLEKMEEQAEASGGALDALAKLTGLGQIERFSAGAGRAGDALLGVAKQTTMVAARAEELYAVLDNLAERNDLATSTVRGLTSAVKDQGITTEVAVNLISQFVRSNLDLSKASELARIAQDAAVISMEDSSQALAGLLHGVLTLQPELLRYRGIIVDFQSEYKKFADANDRSVLSLTGAEKQAIALEAVIREGASVAGTYEAAMDTASKQLRSFDRYMKELAEDMGQATLPIFTEMVFTAKDLVKQFRDLPKEVKATIGVTSAVTGAMLKGTSTAVQFGAQIGQVAVALKTLQISAGAATLGLVGLTAALGAVAAIGIATYLNEQEKAHIAEAAAVATSTENYESYLVMVEGAELGSYALSERLYDIAKAAEEAGSALTAAALTEALAELEGVFGAAPTGIPFLDELITKSQEGQFSVEYLKDAVARIVPTLDEAGLAVLRDVETLERWGRANGWTTEQTQVFIDILSEAVDAEELLRANVEYATVSMGDHEERMLGLVDRTSDLEYAMRDLGGQALDMADAMTWQAQAADLASDALARSFGIIREGTPEVRRLREEFLKLAEAEGMGAAVAATMQMYQDALQRAADQRVDIGEKADADRAKAWAQFEDDRDELARKHADARADVARDLAQVEIDLREGVVEAERQAAEDRVAAAEDMARDIEQAERDLARDRAQVAEDLAERLADLERRHAQDVEDLNRDLARDLADIEREHAADMEGLKARHLATLEDLERDYYAGLEKLAQDYGDKLAAITERYARERQSILEKYSLEDEGPSIDEQREALIDRIRELERLQREGTRGIDYGPQIRQLKAQLEDLKEQELAALEDRKQAELDELEAWLAEEQAVRDAAYEEAQAAEEAAYQESLEAEEAAYEERKLERERQHAERLADLETALARERQELEIDAGRRLADLEAAHAEEVAAIHQHYADRLAEIDAGLADEKEALDAAAQDDRDRLAQRLQDEIDNYGERQTELQNHYDAQLGTIDEKEQEQYDAVLEKTGETVADLVAAWEGLDPEMARVLDAILWNAMIPGIRAWEGQATGEAYQIGQKIIQALRRGMEDAAESGSPSKMMIRFGQNLVESLGMGMPEGRMREAGARAFGAFRVGMETALADAEAAFENWAGPGARTLPVVAELDAQAAEEGLRRLRDEAGTEEGEGVPRTFAGRGRLLARISPAERALSGIPDLEREAREAAMAFRAEVAGALSQPALVEGPRQPTLPRLRQEPASITNQRTYELNYQAAPQDYATLRGQVALMEIMTGG